MKKQILASAVAATLVSPVMAQNMTISGFFNASYDLFSVSQPAGTRAGRLKEDRVTDNSSRILFNVSEDLGGGMRAIGQFDLRVAMDAMQPIGPVDNADDSRAPANVINGGNNHVGLSGSLGTIRFGRQDIQYTENATFHPVGTATIAQHVGLFNSAGGDTTIMTGATRVPNLIWWVSPRWNGIQATAGYSTNPIGNSSNPVQAENDLAKPSAAGNRKGSGTWLKLDATIDKLTVVYSQIQLQSDYTGLAQNQNAGGARAAAVATQPSGIGALGANAHYTGAALPDHEGKIMTAKYNLGNGWQVGLGQSRNKVTTVTTGASVSRNGTQFGLGYTTGAHQAALSYTSMSDVKTGAGARTADSGTTAITIAYGYNLSKRTQLAASYVVMDNEANAANGLFYNTATVMANASALGGEKHSAYSFGIRHSF